MLIFIFLVWLSAKPEDGGHPLACRPEGGGAGITATAHKLARIVYRLIKHGEAYVRQGLEDYEKKFAARKLHALQKSASALGFDLVHKQILSSGVS